MEFCGFGGEKKMSDTFVTKIVGVTYKNPDGTDRQKIIKKCKKGEPLKLVREPDNPVDEHAIAVFRETGEKIGYIASHVAFRAEGAGDLAPHMDEGGGVRAKVVEIIGGPSGFLGLQRKSYGCVIEITKGTIPYRAKDYEGYGLIQKAKSLEKSEPDKAIALYLKGMKALYGADKLYKQFRSDGKARREWNRETAYPVNRLAMLLDKKGRYIQCLQLIIKYEQIENKRGISKLDMESISKRKARIIKKISLSTSDSPHNNS